MKICIDCHRELSLDAFHRRGSSRDGRVNICKDCMHARYIFRRTGSGEDRRRKPRAGDGQKWCPRCKQSLSLASFGSNASRPDGLTAYCLSCHNRVMRENRIKIEGSTRNYHLKRRYGLTDAEVKQLIEDQGGVCAVCWVNKPEHVDHDHRTGRVRGILCFNCNGGLGQFKDDVDRLINAIAYLEGSPCLIEPAEPVDSPSST